MVELHVGDVGVLIRAIIKDSDGVAVNLSATTTRQLIFTRPDGTTLTVAAALESGVDGKMTYTTVAGDLSQEGIWKIQAYVATSSWSAHSSVSKFRVRPNL